MRTVPLILFQPPGGRVSLGAPHPVLPGTEDRVARLAALGPCRTWTRAAAFGAGCWVSEGSLHRTRETLSSTKIQPITRAADPACVHQPSWANLLPSPVTG